MLSGLFGFSGRIGRGSWWLGQLVMFAMFWIVFAVYVALQPTAENVGADNSMITGVVGGIGLILVLVINFCTTVTRFHDRGKSGFWFLMSFVPIIGLPWVLIECGMLPGEDGSNRFGAPPGSDEAVMGTVVSQQAPASANFAKLDDAYMADYARKLEQQQAKNLSTEAVKIFGTGGSAPVFGKR